MSPSAAAAGFVMSVTPVNLTIYAGGVKGGAAIGWVGHGHVVVPLVFVVR